MNHPTTYFAVALILNSVITCLLASNDYFVDLTICNPLNGSQPQVLVPAPNLPKGFSTRIQWTWLEKDSTVDVLEVFNGVTQKGSQIIYMEGQTIQVIQNYKEQQYISYTQANGCNVRGLGTFEFYDNKLWLSSMISLYGAAKSAQPVYNGTSTVRGVDTKKYVACMWLYQFNITVQVEMHFSNNWAMPISTPDVFAPVRFVLRGSTSPNDTVQGRIPFTVIGDFSEYKPFLPDDETEMKMQLPAGTFCPGRFSITPLNPLPTSFSVIQERIDSTRDTTTVTYEEIWFDKDKRLVRRDYKSADGSDPDPTTQIFDFNLGIHYSIDTYMGTCDPVALLDTEDLYVLPGPNNTVRMMTSEEFFHVKDALSQYVGTRITRGVRCDVWVGLYVDVDSMRNYTIEWYFTVDSVVEGVGGIIQPASLFRYDIWQGQGQPTVFNILKMNKEKPLQEVFDVSQCYQFASKARILIYFSVINNKTLSMVSGSYLKETLHMDTLKEALLSPLQMTRVSIQTVSTGDVYLDGILLDKSPIVNDNIFPPAPERHDLGPAIMFLQGSVGNGWTLSLDSTVINETVLLKSQGILRIKYDEQFTTTPSTTTMSTTIATPPQPAPTTARQIAPTEQTPPVPITSTLGPTSPSKCTCPPNTCSSPSIVTNQTPARCPQVTTPPPCIPTPCPVITCPQLTCPTTTYVTPVKCPAQTPCPTTTQRNQAASATKCPVLTPCPTITTTTKTQSVTTIKIPTAEKQTGEQTTKGGVSGDRTSACRGRRWRGRWHVGRWNVAWCFAAYNIPALQTSVTGRKKHFG
ncbi:uncharacterized protein LOC127845940 isoform X2 [Dreissena polymorpha]|uniref:uncharacterized protein LOC127845940 isoform X2 n=1 Tax=Dreissena polymorpha TaxID=45954 RepID=UPI002263D10A|nr:uncharacterized protein LOC127845940 isoform X2 [Dreissena polymorpha]